MGIIFLLVKNAAAKVIPTITTIQEATIATIAPGDKLEEACLNTLNSGIMTKDLSTLATGVEVKQVNSEEFLKAIRQELEKIL